MQRIQNNQRSWRRDLLRDRWLYVMLLPGIIYFLVYKYLPMWGVIIAFQNYSPALGILDSAWVGLKHFNRLFSEPTFWQLFRNTLLLSLYQIVFFFPIPIILALMLNELKNQVFKRFVQTIIYIPHFVSWVVIVGISYLFLTPEGGFINEAIAATGNDKVNFLMSEDWFRTLQIGQVIWKEAGWGTIIFLAALAGVDPQLYEAARMDGANRWRQLWHITLPALKSTIIILFILRLGDILEQGAEHILLLLNALNRQVGEVFDTYVYTVGLLQGNFSYSAAVGLFKSLVGLILVLVANYTAKKAGEEGVF
ncbi:sugar ABC transporter permease [Paenibacillus sp. F411]|uniref:YteP6 n=1 Tax=Paenibacillus algicola TaxID=2565926 RepID=A0A4P8XP92_9BACL|nr:MULTISPECIES: sugar ABC transporter permease [Paenibacillus]MBO2944618.1 sugar ABC transporter permease [Paenibacillus sp. F411]QCT04747.1 YteP6 [Paenibacillus algicola]